MSSMSENPTAVEFSSGSLQVFSPFHSEKMQITTLIWFGGASALHLSQILTYCYAITLAPAIWAPYKTSYKSHVIFNSGKTFFLEGVGAIQST
jgi:hypothetical protein